MCYFENSIKIVFHRDNFISGAQSFFYSTWIEWRIICVHYAEDDYSLNCSAELKITSTTIRTKLKNDR